MSSLPASIKRIGSKTTEKRWRHRFSHYKSMGAFLLPWKPEFWSNLPQNRMQTFPHPSDATHKIWTRVANWLQTYSSLKVWTMTTDGRRPLVYYQLTLWAFGSGELKTGLFRTTWPYLHFVVKPIFFSTFLENRRKILFLSYNLQGSPGVGRNTFLSSPHLFHHSNYLWFICFPWWSLDELENLHADRTTVCFDRSWGRGWVPVKPV